MNKHTKPIDKIYEIKARLKAGQISFDEAKMSATPLIKEMEKSAERIAKKFRRKPPKFNFIGLMR